jgi:anti-sigma factor RsiW
MNSIDHERARKLIEADAVEGITGAERDWLSRHLSACSECSNKAAALVDAINALRAVPIAASPELVRQTRLAVHRRAEELKAARAWSAPLWIATAISSASVILTTPYVWRTFGWLGHMVHLPDAVWQVGFLMWWFLPATVLAGAVASRYAAETNWRQS